MFHSLCAYVRRECDQQYGDSWILVIQPKFWMLPTTGHAGHATVFYPHLRVSNWVEAHKRAVCQTCGPCFFTRCYCFRMPFAFVYLASPNYHFYLIAPSLGPANLFLWPASDAAYELTSSRSLSGDIAPAAHVADDSFFLTNTFSFSKTAFISSSFNVLSFR